MESVFWTLSVVILCFNLGFSHGSTEPLRISIPLGHSGPIVKRNPPAAPTGAPGNPPPEAPQQQNRQSSTGAPGNPPPEAPHQQNRQLSSSPQGLPHQEAAQPRSDSPPESDSSSSSPDSTTSTPSLASESRLHSKNQNSKKHKSSRPKPDSDKASPKLSDESTQVRAQIPRRPPGRPGPQGMQEIQPERQHSHSYSPSPQSAPHSHGSHFHGPAYHGQQQHQQQQPGPQFLPVSPAGNPPGIVEVQLGSHMPSRHPPQMGSEPHMMGMSPSPQGTLDPNPLFWEEVREFLSKPVLADLFSGFGWGVNMMKAAFRKMPILLDQIETTE